jgi:glycine hydroxymethyltransferase
MRDTEADRARLDGILEGHRAFRASIVPLCAAETPLSDYVRSFMLDSIHETYAMGGPRRPVEQNFAGSRFVLDLHQLTIDLCRTAYGAVYADPRPHSGTTAVTSCLMTLSQPGQRVLLQTVTSGGHASMDPICRRLGLEVVDLPYDFERLEPDYDAMRDMDLSRIDFVLYAPSDVLYPAAFSELGLDEKTIVILDLTQTLGLIASGHHPSPFETDHERTIVTGGTHKTLPGPSTGLLMTNDPDLADQLDGEVSPKFVRHSHPHHIAALCATLIEHQVVGKRYGDRILELTRDLDRLLSQAGIDVIRSGTRVSETHHVWVHIEDAYLNEVFARAVDVGLTLNPRRKELFRSSGLRFGTQEIARYQWRAQDVEALASLIADVLEGRGDVPSLQSRVIELARRNVFSRDMCMPPSEPR